MVRKGYNTNWLWKKWGAEHQAAIQAIRAGRLQEAEAAMERADQVGEQIAGQMEIFDLLPEQAPRAE